MTRVVQAAVHAVHELGSLGAVQLSNVMEIKEVLSMLLSPVVRRAVVKHVAATCDGGEGVAPALQGVDGALRGGENVMLTLQWNHGHAQDGEVRPLACRPKSTSVNERENLSSGVLCFVRQHLLRAANVSVSSGGGRNKRKRAPVPPVPLAPVLRISRQPTPAFSADQAEGVFRCHRPRWWRRPQRRAKRGGLRCRDHPLAE